MFYLFMHSKMFLVNNPHGIFLTKKIGGKTISTKLKGEIITSSNLKALTHKESELIFTSQLFQTFKKQLHNAEILPDLIYQTKLILNILEAMPLLDDESPIYQQGISLKNRFEITFPVEFILHSNHIEGSKIPEEEIRKILENKKSTYHIKNEIIEVKNSIKAWNFLQDDFLRNLANIKKLYHILTKDLLQETGNPYPRGFKKVPIVVNNVQTVDPEAVKMLLVELIKEIKS